MATRRACANDARRWKFSSAPVMRRFGVLALLVMIAIIAAGVLQASEKMETRTRLLAQSLDDKIEYRVSESLNLLESLAAQDLFLDPDVSVDEKIDMLDRVSQQFGYMMIRYVDQDINVWSSRGSTSLASRDYMQALFTTGDPQVTDSFLAGADGTTLNYTVAVPLIENGEVKGALFCAIYFDEIVELLRADASGSDADALLLGSQGQIMSATDEGGYGESYLDALGQEHLMGTTAFEVEANFLKKVPASFWSVDADGVVYTAYTPIESTNWTLVCSMGLLSTALSLAPTYLIILLATAILFGVVMWLTHRSITSQLKVVDMLVDSVQELEHRIYQDDRPQNADLDDIIRMTSTGLSDGLTGVSTRTVFMNQLEALLASAPSDKLVALCFVDMDDLKLINDTYGHEVGDVALKGVGYVLREYEKKYGGLVGRYGGDEFIVVLADIDTDQELREVLGELSLRLRSSVSHEGESIPVKCSVGVSVWDRQADAATLIKEADEALYFVKLNGKSFYRVYQDGTS